MCTFRDVTGVGGTFQSEQVFLISIVYETWRRICAVWLCLIRSYQHIYISWKLKTPPPMRWWQRCIGGKVPDGHYPDVRHLWYRYEVNLSRSPSLCHSREYRSTTNSTCCNCNIQYGNRTRYALGSRMILVVKGQRSKWTRSWSNKYRYPLFQNFGTGCRCMVSKVQAATKLCRNQRWNCVRS